MVRGVLLFLALSLKLPAHDTWVQVNTPVQRAGQPFYVDLMLGNHGNEHRDFKLASKIPLKGSTLELISPDGGKTDLMPGIVDNGLEEKEGFWSAKVLPPGTGLYCAAHTYDAVVSYAPKRAIKSAKVFFLAGSGENSGTFRKPVGHPLEIVPLADPTAQAAGGKLRVRVLFKGQPLPDVVVSAIPKGADLDSGFDPKHEARTDASGEAELPLPEANLYLIATRKKAPEETGETYSAGTEYAATLTLYVAESR